MRMMNLLQEKVYGYVTRYAWAVHMVQVLERTPRHAIHWYALLLLGLVIVLINVGLAWWAFIGADTESVYGATHRVEATTIQRGELERVLETYEAKTATFEAYQQRVPAVIDPGR